MTDESRDALALPGADIVITSSAFTDRGAVRKVNEDSFVASSPVFAVADGMGGHAHGDLASRAAIGALVDAFPNAEATRPERVLEAIRQANRDVLAVSAETARMSIEQVTTGPTVSGTTITGVAFVRVGPNERGHWMVFNVGDSRVYSWDGRRLDQLTVDHSVVQELTDAGSITPESARTHPARNVVTRALGADLEVVADVWLLPATGRQQFLVCSDGLTRELDDEEIARTIVFHGTGGHDDSLAETLVSAAVTAGGHDNVTVVVVESLLAGHDGDGPEQTDTRDRDGLPAYLEETLPRI